MLVCVRVSSSAGALRTHVRFLWGANLYFVFCISNVNFCSHERTYEVEIKTYDLPRSVDEQKRGTDGQLHALLLR